MDYDSIKAMPQEEICERLGYAYEPDKDPAEWQAGCNRYVNNGKHEMEPLGTASSMHDCMACPDLSDCPIKQKYPVWPWDVNIDKDMNEKWNAFQQAKREKMKLNGGVRGA